MVKGGNNKPKHYTPNNRDSEFMEQKLIGLRGKMDKSPIMVRDFHILLSTIDKICRQKKTKDIEDLNHTVNHPDLTFAQHSTQQQHAFSSAHRTFIKIPILGHKTCLKNGKGLESYRVGFLTTMK